VNANGRLSFDVALKAGQAWHRCLIYDLVDGASCVRAPRNAPFQRNVGSRRQIDEWQRTVLKISDQQRGILSLLQSGCARHGPLCGCHLEGTDHMVFVPAAGLHGLWRCSPRHVDRLVADDDRSPGFAAAALEVLGQYQAKKRDDYRDAEPGKILHELRHGELAYFKMIRIRRITVPRMRRRYTWWRSSCGGGPPATAR